MSCISMPLLNTVVGAAMPVSEEGVPAVAERLESEAQARETATRARTVKMDFKDFMIVMD